MPNKRVVILLTISTISCICAVLFASSAFCFVDPCTKGDVSTVDTELSKKILSRHPHFKSFQSEFNIYIGDYLGDEWHNTWNAGGRYFLHLNNTFALGGEYFYSRIDADSASTFGASLTTKDSHTVDGQLMISNDCVFRAGSKIIECDIYLAIGAGGMQINKKWEPTFVVGGGIRIYTPLKWLAFRFDVDSYLHTTPNPAGNTFNADISMKGGVAFQIPKKINPKDKPQMKR